MKKILLFGFLVFVACYANGQSSSDTIVVKKKLGTVFQQNGKNLTPRSLLEITQSNSEAYEEMKIAKSNYDVGYVIGFAGGFLVGWPLGTVIAGGEPNWTLAGIGAGIIVISIPFSSAYTKHAKNAVRIYNNGLRQTGLNNVEFKLGLTCNGLGLKIIF